MLAALTGFLAGLLHVLAGPDHLAAIAPLAVDGARRAWITGLRWGLGHASGVVVVGVLSLLLREVLPVAWLSAWAERAVGVVLIGIGLWSFRRSLTRHVHTHEHEHDGARHIHVHLHADGTAHHHAPVATSAHAHPHAAFGIGTLHGFAGSSHFLGVLPALAFSTRGAAVGYLVAFGLGTVAAMVLFSTAIGLASTRLAGRSTAAYRWWLHGCSGASVVVGGYWLVA